MPPKQRNKSSKRAKSEPKKDASITASQAMRAIERGHHATLLLGPEGEVVLAEREDKASTAA